MAFAHLHVHTEYSALDGLTRVSDLFDHVASLGQTAVATTDHGNLAACWTAQQRADAAGVKYIAGCLLAGQEIVTDQGIKPVEQIVSGDQVLTHRGRFRPVLRTMTRRHQGHAYRVHLADRYSRPLILTDEHPILIRDKHGSLEWLKPGEIAAGRANRHGGSESWMSYVCLPKLLSATQSLQVPDYLPAGERWSLIGGVLGKRSSVRNRRVQWKEFPAVLDVDQEFAYFLGLFAAEGSFGRHRDGRLTGRMTFDLHRDETAYAHRVAQFATSLGGRVQIRERRTNSLVVDVALLPLAHVMDSLVGSGADYKRVPAQILQAPEPVRRSFVEGLIDGDGRSTVPDVSGRRGQFRTTSRDLAWGLRTLLTDRGLFLGISESHPAGKRAIYTVSYREDAAYRRTIEDENFVYRPIRAIERFNLDDDVYNFEVQDDNSYVSDFVLHNCEFYLAIGSRFERNVLWVNADDNSADEDEERPDEDSGTDEEQGDDKQHSGSDGRKARRYMHLTVLATTPAGWTNLVRLNNLAQESIWQKPRIDFELLSQHAEGLIVLTGCLGGPILGPLTRRQAAVDRMQALEEQLRDDDNKQGADGALTPDERTELQNQLVDASADANAARENLEALIDAVGRENVYVELMEHGIPSESAILVDAVDLAREYEVGIVATNDAHHTHAEDADAHAAWLLVQSKSTLDNPKYAFHGEGYWLRSEAEMRALRPESWWQEACDTSQTIADRCAPRTLPSWRNLMPSYETPPGHDSNLSYLFHMLRAGAHRRYGGIDADTQARVRSEVDVIAGAGMVDYFLIVEDLISWARSTRPVAPGGAPKKPILVGPGRGSGGGSEVAYLLNLTQVPPQPNGLLFERFYELGRSEPPDFDIDFPETRRDEVIEYLGHRYGRANVAFLGTFMVDRTKAAIKHAARILSLDALGAKMTDLVPLVSAKPMAPDVMMDPEQPAAAEYRRMVENDANARRIHEYAARFHDVIAGYGIHASGIIVSAVPLADLVPLRRSKRGWVIQWSGTDAEQLGLLKVDVLGLRSLDVVDKAVEYIRESTGEDIDWMALPDPAAAHDGLEATRVAAAWKVMAEGRTAGIFQLESPAMTELAMSVAPNSLNDVSALVALFRPGPMAAGMHETYARRKRGEEPVDYRVFTADPAEQAQIATVLGETYGVICVTGDTRVHSVSRGHEVPIREIAVGEQVQGVNSLNQEAVGTVSAVMENGRKRIIETRFPGGRSLRSTPDHRVLTPAGWVEIGNLGPGDMVAAPWTLLGDDGEGTAREQARGYVLGALLGDGGLTPPTAINLYSATPDVLDRFESALNAGFGLTATRSVGTRGVLRARINGPRGGTGTNGAPGAPGNACLHWLRALGLKHARGGVTSATKFIPAAFLAAPIGVVRQVLAGLWDTDGMFARAESGPLSGYKTISAQLARDVSFLLQRLGIASTITTDAQAFGASAHHVGVIDVRELASQLAPHLGNTTRRALALRIASIPGSRRCARGSVLPNSVVRPALRRAGVSTKTFRQGQRTGYGRVAALAQLTGDHELLRLANVRWVPIIGQEDAGIENVYDITVDELHSFVGNGLIIHNCFQEQIMQLGTVVAGMDATERSKLRKAVSKKKKDMMALVRERFVSGAVEEVRDVSGAVVKMAFAETTAITLWDMIVGFAEYAFNRAHSATYGLLSYVTAYLKGNWPTDFAAATLAVTDGDLKRIQILRSLREEGVEVLPPDVNRSQAETFPERAGAIRFGLSEIKGLNKALGGLIVTERERSGEFESLHDIIRLVNVPRVEGDKTTAAAVKSNDIRNLIDSGAVDSFGPRLGQTLTAAAAGLEAFPPPSMEWGVLERATRQRDRLLISLGEHPLLALAEQVDAVTIRASGDSQFDRKPIRVEHVPDRPGEIVHVLAVLGSWAERAYSKGRMANLRIDGIEQSIPGTMWDSELAEHNRSPLTRPLVGDIVTVHGKVRYREILTDPRDPDSETVSVKEMQVYSVRKVDVTDPATGSFPQSPYPRIDFTAPPETAREPVLDTPPPLFVDIETAAPIEIDVPSPQTAATTSSAPALSAAPATVSVAVLEAPPVETTASWSIEPGLTPGVPVSAGWAPSAAIANAGSLVDRAAQRELLAVLKAAHATHQVTTYTAFRGGEAVLVLQLE